MGVNHSHSHDHDHRHDHALDLDVLRFPIGFDRIVVVYIFLCVGVFWFLVFLYSEDLVILLRRLSGLILLSILALL